MLGELECLESEAQRALLHERRVRVGRGMPMGSKAQVGG